MTNRPQVFEHLGAYAQGPIAELCELTERVWLTYHEFSEGHEHQGQKSREYLITRMLYIAEITSSAIRLDASWALTHAAMSLLRDRYEQTVRFSWLVRNPDTEEFHKYERAMFAKMNSLVRSLNAETRKHYEQIMGGLPDWVTTTPTKKERAYLDAWNSLDLRSMAAKRDALASVNEERRTNRASEFGCTERFSDFRRYQTIEPYVEFFRRIGLQPIQVDQNRQHFVYVELIQKELSSRGYLNFRGGDRLVLVFTTNSAASTEITSFTANFFTGVPS